MHAHAEVMRALVIHAYIYLGHNSHIPVTCAQVIPAHTPLGHPHPQVTYAHRTLGLACSLGCARVALVVHEYPRPSKSPYPQATCTA